MVLRWCTAKSCGLHMTSLQIPSCTWLQPGWVNHFTVKKKHHWIPQPLQWVTHQTDISVKHIVFPETSNASESLTSCRYNGRVAPPWRDNVNSTGKSSRNQWGVNWFITLTPSCYVLVHYLSSTHWLLQTDTKKSDNDLLKAGWGNLMKSSLHFSCFTSGIS